MPANPTGRRGEERGYTQLAVVVTIGNGFRVLTRQPLKDKEGREIDRSLLKSYVLLETVYLGVWNMGSEDFVADHPNALREAEQKGVGRGNIIKRRHNP